MPSSLLALPLLLTLLSPIIHPTTAETIEILAHQNFGTADPFEFRPNDIVASPGDILEFHFGGPGEGVLGGNHSVAQGTFDSPCVPAEGGGFWSGFHAINATSKEADMVFRVEVNDTEPIVFYCALGPHCARGMHGVVNGNGERSLRGYRGMIDVNFEGTVPTQEPGFAGRLVNNTAVNILPAEDASAAGRTRVVSGAVLMAGLVGGLMLL